MEKTLEGFRGRCTTLWSCRDFTGPQNNHLRHTGRFGKQYEQLGKVFEAKFRPNLCLWRLTLFGSAEKGKYSPFGCRCFYLYFSGLQKMSKTNESCARLQELIKNKYKLRLCCRCETENYSVPVQGTLCLTGKWMF